jgi:curved DNA-binding protein CbpA
MNYDFGLPQTTRTTDRSSARSGHSNAANAAPPDPYEVLNLPRDADINTIKNKFRTLTRLHHPDRNRRNPNYDPNYYAAVCSAYETLSDPRKKLAYDQSAAAGFNVLKSAAQSYATAQPAGGGQSSFTQRATFGDGDARQFNEAFEKHRRGDPTDRGYGDMMAGRITEQEAKSGQRPVDAPTNVFGGATKVSPGDFNNRFQTELQTKRRTRAQAIQERGEGEPEGWMGGAARLGVSDISMFDGVIINQEASDFSGAAGSVQFADYMAGFETITEQLPENHEYLTATGDAASLKKKHGERMAQLSSVPDRGHQMSFQQAEVALQSQREREMQSERDRNRQVVLRYRDQYASQDLLPGSAGAPSKRESAQAMNQSLADRTFFQGGGSNRRL